MPIARAEMSTAIGSCQDKGVTLEAVTTKKRKGQLSRELKGLPARLKVARQRAGLDSTELDRVAGVAQGRTSRAEHGKRLERLTANAVIEWARACKVNPGWLLTGQGDMRLGDTPVPPSDIRPTT